MSKCANGHQSPNVPLERTLTAVLEISQTINLSRGWRTMLQDLAHKVHSLMGYDCAVILLDPESRLLTWVGSYGLSDHYVELMNAQHNNLRTPAMSQGAIGRAYRTMQPVQINDIDDPSVQLWRQALLDEGIASFIATPMVFHQRVLGFINCYTRHPHTFSQPEVELLSIIGNQAAIAVEAGRLHDQERHRAEELSALNEKLRRQHNALLQAEQIHRQLTEMILNDAGLDAIVATIAQLVGRPILLLSAGLKPLAEAGLRERAQLGPSDRLDVTPPPQLPVGHPYQAPLNADRVDVGPMHLPYQVRPGLTLGAYTVPIRANGMILGYLAAFDMAAPVDELDRRAIEHGVTVVALELLEERAVLQAEQQLRGRFLDDLLAGDYESEESIIRRAGYLGFDFGPTYRVLAIGLDPQAHESAADPDDARAVDILRRHVLNLTVASCSARYPKALVTLKGDTVAVVWPEHPDGKIRVTEVARRLKYEINRALRGPSVSIGIGGPCDQPFTFARSYGEARFCLDLLHRFGNIDRTLTIDELGLHRFLINAGSDTQLLDFAHLRLDRLLEHERHYGGELLRTLRAYLETECSLTRTAERIGVHVNTVQYRLRRVSELTGTSLRSPQGLMEIELALLVAALSPRCFPGIETDDTRHPC